MLLGKREKVVEKEERGREKGVVAAGTMGKVVERKRRKKKKGRPSLLDLQKRSIKEQQQQKNQQLQQPRKRTPNPNFKTNPITPNSFRRSTRRNPNPDGDLSAAENNEAVGDEDDELTGKRREKKLKLVLKLPSQRSSLNSSSLNSDSYNSVSNAEDDIDAANHKKRKVNAIGDGSGQGHTEKEEKQASPPKPTQALQGTQLDMGPSTPLPDKKLLLFIIDRLQKKDTYAVFSEPVDPNELPDYHEVIEHPMDFGTVRKKLASGAYANMEQFEKDVFLICSNAMQYNAPDTIYFRQARSIEELAKKSFENLRQDSDNNEPERKIVRRGRPPTKKMLWPSLERAGSEFSSDATLATQAENPTWSNYDLKKGLLFDKSGPADDSGRLFLGSRNSEPYSGRLAERTFERNGEFTGSILKGNWMKNGKKQVGFGENRRNTYKQSHLSTGGREPSVLTTFDGERKQLMTVGLHSEYGYARSLARFAANPGPIAWKIASMKIEKSLPAGINFGPGWVGENEAVPPRPLVLPGNSSKLSIVEMISGKSLEDPERNNQYEKRMPSTCSDSDSHPNRLLLSPPTTSSSPVVTNRSPETITESSEANRGLNSHSSFNMLSGNVGVIRPSTPFQILQNPVFRDGMNGVNGAYGFNFPVQMGKLTGSVRPTGIKFHSSRIDDTISRANSSVVHPPAANSLSSGDSKLLENTGRINSGTSLPKAGCKGLATPKMGHQSPASWQEVSQQQKPDSVPPDLNIRFQTTGSPNSSRVDSTQPDLALQL